MNTSFYNSSNTSINGVEIAILAHDIILPEIDGKLTYSLLYDIEHAKNRSPRYYRTKESEYKVELGRFFIPILTPSISRESIVQEDKSAPKVKSKSVKLETDAYVNANTISLEIPKYLVCEFTDKIPAGTQFLFVSLSGRVREDKIRIIGIYSSMYSNPEEKKVLGGAKKK